MVFYLLSLYVRHRSSACPPMHQVSLSGHLTYQDLELHSVKEILSLGKKISTSYPSHETPDVLFRSAILT